MAMTMTTPAEQFVAEQVEELRDIIADLPSKLRLRGVEISVVMNMPADDATDDLRGVVDGSRVSVYAVTHDIASIGGAAVGERVDARQHMQAVWEPYVIVSTGYDAVRTLLTLDRVGAVRGGRVYG